MNKKIMVSNLKNFNFVHLNHFMYHCSFFFLQVIQVQSNILMLIITLMFNFMFYLNREQFIKMLNVTIC